MARRTSTWRSPILWGVIILFIILGLGYSSLTPVFENSDETLHYPYVKHLADGQGLPRAIPDQPWNQEGTQPPLYYALVAASTFWIDSDNLPELLQPNPHWLFTEVRTFINDNQNLVLHGPAESFPYRRAALAVHGGRWWSLLFGVVTVICTYLLAHHLFPDNMPLVVTATGLTAFTPQFLRVSTTVSNDSLAAALTTLAVLLALKFTEPPHQLSRPFFRPLLLGAVTGLALLTKLSSLSTLFLVVFIIFWRSFFLGEVHQSPLRKMLRWWAVIGLATIILTGWWFWRNYQLYGEWLATETHLNLAGRSYLSPAGVWDLRAEAARAYWATFGWGQIRPPEGVYQLLFWLTGISLIGLGLALLAKLIQGSNRGPFPLNAASINFEKIVILLLWVGLNTVLYWRWVMDVGSVSHTRLVFPAIAAISLLLALGWHAWLPDRLAGAFSGLVLLFFVGLNLYSLGWLLYPAFRPGQALALDPDNAVQAASPAPVPVDVTFLDSLKLEAGYVYPKGEASTQVKHEIEAPRNQVVIIRTLWEVLAPLNKNYSVAAVLLAPDGQVLAQRQTYPGLGLRPTAYLHPGDRFWDLYPLRLEQVVTEPVVARAAVTLFDMESDTKAGFPALDAAGNQITPVVGQIKVVPDPWPLYQPAHNASANFADAINLIGYDLAGVAQTGRTELQLTLYWQCQTPVSTNFLLFIHLLDAEGQLVGQADAPPTHNRYPTSWWAPGETIAGRHTFDLLPETAKIRLGFYELNSGQRLPITASSLPTQDNGLEIDLR